MRYVKDLCIALAISASRRDMRLTRLVLAALAALLLRQEAEDFGERERIAILMVGKLEIFLSQFPKYREENLGNRNQGWCAA